MKHIKNLSILATLTVLVITLAECSSRNAQGIDPAFNDTLALIEEEFTSRGKALVIDFGIVFDTVTDNNAADCLRSGGNKFIRVNRDKWDSSPTLTRKYLITHELGHCLLNREHDNSVITFLNVTIPKTIMTTNFDSLISFAAIPEINNYYFNELLGIETLN